MLVFLLLTLWATIVGHALLRLVRVDFDDVSLSFLTAVAMGFACISLITVALALVGFLDWYFLSGILAFSGLLSMRHIVEIPRVVRAVRERWTDLIRRNRVLASIVVAAILTNVFFSVAGCFAPETGWDAGVYHFALPKLYVAHHGLVVREDLLHSFFPMNIEMLYTAGFLLSGETCASLFNLLMYLLLVVAVIELCRVVMREDAALLSVAVFLGFFSFLLQSSGGDVDLAQAFFSTVYLILLLQGMALRSLRMIALCGFFFGFILGIKYTGALMGTIFITMFADAWRSRDAAPGFVWKSVLLFCLPTLLFGAIWYVVTYVRTGDCLYAMTTMSRLFPGHTDDLRGAIKEMISAWRYDVLALLFPFAFFSRKSGRYISQLIVTCMAVLIVIAVKSLGGNTTNAVRYSMMIMPTMCVLTAMTLRTVMTRRRMLGVITILIVLAPLVLSSVGHAIRNFPKWRSEMSGVSRDQYLSERINTYWAILHVNADGAEAGKVLLIGERGYYFDVSYLSVTDYHSIIDFDRMTSADEFLKILRDRGITYLIVDRQRYGRARRITGVLERLNALTEQNGFTHIGDRNECALYRFNGR